MHLSSQAANIVGEGVETKESVAVVAKLSACSAKCNKAIIIQRLEVWLISCEALLPLTLLMQDLSQTSASAQG